MRVAIMEAHGYLDKQIQRLLANHEIKGDIVPNLTRSVVQQYDVLIVTHKTDIPNVTIVLEQIILDGDINVIYVSNNPNIGHFYNLYHDIRFNMINETTMEVELPVTVKLMDKYMRKIRSLTEEVEDIKGRLDTLEKTNKAKRMLMMKGLSEAESHNFIQKKAMDLRVSKNRLVNLIIENKIDI